MAQTTDNISLEQFSSRSSKPAWKLTLGGLFRKYFPLKKNGCWSNIQVAENPGALKASGIHSSLWRRTAWKQATVDSLQRHFSKLTNLFHQFPFSPPFIKWFYSSVSIQMHHRVLFHLRMKNFLEDLKPVSSFFSCVIWQRHLDWTKDWIMIVIIILFTSNTVQQQ